jgi:hypothetical protein
MSDNKLTIKLVFPCGAHYPVLDQSVAEHEREFTANGMLSFCVANSWQSLTQPLMADGTNADCWSCTVSKRRGRNAQRVFVCDADGGAVLGFDGRPMLGRAVSCKAKREVSDGE